MCAIRHISEITVRYQETDRMGVAYHSNYFIWFEIGRTELFTALGIPYRGLEAEGFFFIVTDARCRYNRPVTYDDTLLVATHLSEMERTRMTFSYSVAHQGQTVAEGLTCHVFVDHARKVVRIPPRVRLAMEGKGNAQNEG